MPIPFIIWGLVAIGGALAAKKVVESESGRNVLTKAGEGLLFAQNLGRLFEMSETGAMRYLDNWVPQMKSHEWQELLRNLRDYSCGVNEDTTPEYRSRARILLAYAEAVRNRSPEV